MKVINLYLEERIQQFAQRVVYYSVGKSILVFGHDLQLPDEVKKWVRDFEK